MIRTQKPSCRTVLLFSRSKMSKGWKVSVTQGTAVMETTQRLSLKLWLPDESSSSLECVVTHNSKGMLDLSNMVKCEPDNHTRVNGRIEAADVNWCSEVAAELHNWRIVILHRVWRERRGSGRIKRSFDPKTHHCLIILWVHTSRVDICKSTTLLVGGVRDVQIRTGLHHVHNDGCAGGNEVTADIMVK